MTLDQLLTFLAVVESLSFSEAARKLNQSQPAISQQIKALETDLGLMLFDRTSRQLQLTKAGEKLLPYAQRIRQEAQSIRFALQELSGEVAGELRIGASTTNGNYVIPKVLVKLKERYPKLEINLAIENNAKLLCDLQKGLFDLVLLEGPKPEVSQRFQVAAFYEDHLVVVKNTQFKIPKPLSLKKVLEYPWIMREQGSGTRDILLEKLAKAGFSEDQIKHGLVLGSINSVKVALQHSESFSYLSRLAIAHELELGELEIVNIPELNTIRSLWMVTPQPQYSNAAIKTFIKTLQST